MIEKISNTYRRVSCPLCNSSAVHYIGDLSYSSPVYYSSHAISLSRTPELWKCNTCSSLYSNNIIPENIAISLYTRGISGERWSQKSLEAGKPLEIIGLLAEKFSPGKKIIDVGCNTGEVLDFARNRGCITTGIEISKSSHSQLQEKGHKYFSSIHEVDDMYDAIIAFDIVEHMYDLPLFFELCKKILLDKGIILILTGNINSISAKICKSGWWYMNYPEHIIFPSRKFFKNLDGFRITNWINTYAAINYRQPVPEIVKGVFKGLYKRNYNGLPSIGPDHALICLSKI